LRRKLADGYLISITTFTLDVIWLITLAIKNFANPRTLESEEKFQNHPCCTLLGSLLGHTRAVLTIAFSPDGKILATGSDDNTIKLWKASTGQLITTLLGHSWSVVAITFTADSETVISASWDKTVKLWRVSTAEELATLFGHVDSVSAVAVSQVAQLIASGSKDKTIKLWQLVKQQGS
jgi:WD40 repeat protein